MGNHTKIRCPEFKSQAIKKTVWENNTETGLTLLR